jgi:hypothetical protein
MGYRGLAKLEPVSPRVRCEKAPPSLPPVIVQVSIARFTEVRASRGSVAAVTARPSTR